MQRIKNIFFGVAVFFFLGWLPFPEKNSFVLLSTPYILISSLVCYVLAVVFHESGHVLADLIVGFKIRKINLFFLSIHLTSFPKVTFRKLNDGIEGAVLIKSPDVIDDEEVKRVRIKFMFTSISGPIVSLLIFCLLFNSADYLIVLLSLMNFICFVKSISSDLRIFYKTLTIDYYIYIVLVASDLASGELPNPNSCLFIGKKLDNFLREKYCYEFFIGETVPWALNFILLLSFISKKPLINHLLLMNLKACGWKKNIEEADSEESSLFKKNMCFLALYITIFKKSDFTFVIEALSLIDEEIDKKLLVICSQNERDIKMDDSFFEVENNEFYANVYKQIFQILNGGKLHEAK